jgi:hypothetical protein
MQAVLCRVCGKREWGHVCRGTDDGRRDLVVDAGTSGLEKGSRRRDIPVVTRSRREASVEKPASEKVAVVKGGFDRTSYQRDYMRRKRGEGRERCEACGHLIRVGAEVKPSRAEYMREYRKEAPSSKESRARLDRVTGAIWLLTGAVELMARGGFDRDIVLGQLRQVLVTLGEGSDG